MAYAATVTVDRKGGEIRVTISETEAASTSEATDLHPVERQRHDGRPHPGQRDQPQRG
jgi:hypothetical protein